MPPARRKAPKLIAPQTIEEATSLLGDFANIITEVESLRTDADQAIAEIQAARDSAVAPLEQRAKDIFRQLRPWWAVAAPSLTDGKRKSIELAGCRIGERTPPPSLAHPGQTAGEAIAGLLTASLGTLFVRVATSLDRQALIKAIGLADDEQATEEQRAIAAKLTAIGFQRRQEDEFFIDRAAVEPADPEQVQLEDAA